MAMSKVSGSSSWSCSTGGPRTIRQSVLEDQLLGQVDRVGLHVDPDTGDGGEPLGDLHHRPAAATTDVEQPAAVLEPLAEAGSRGSTRSRKMRGSAFSASVTSRMKVSSCCW